MKDMIKLAIADDETLFRQGLAMVLSREANINIDIQAENGNDLLKQLEKNELPEVILMDLKMPDLNGVETTKMVRKLYPEIKIIALTSYYSKPFILNMIEQGAVAYLAKNAAPQEVIHTINEVAIKGFYYDKNVMSILEEVSLKSKHNSKKNDDFLTRREREVLKQICEQKTTTEIADTLFISPRTVEGHRNNLLLKTGSKNIAGLVIYAIENQIFLSQEEL